MAINPERPVESDTPSKALGSLTHTLVLEPHQAPARYVVGHPGQTKAASSAKRRLAANPAAEWVTYAAYEQALGMAKAIRNDTLVSKMLAGNGMAEASLYWHNEEHGVDCKARPDYVPEGKGWLIDLKTSRQTTPHGFARDAAKLGYVLQAAWYLDGWAQIAGTEPKGLAWVVVANAYPYSVQVYTMGFNSAEHQQARDQYRMLVRAYVACLEAYGTNPWPAPKDPVPIGQYLPDWFAEVPDVIFDLK